MQFISSLMVALMDCRTVAEIPRQNFHISMPRSGATAGDALTTAYGPPRHRSEVNLARLATARPTIPGRRTAQSRMAGYGKERQPFETPGNVDFGMHCTRPSRTRRLIR